jgi:hypothetical protein
MAERVTSLNGGHIETIRDKYGDVLEECENYQIITFPITHGPRAEVLSRRMQNLGTIRRMLPPTLLTTMVSQYDAFLSRVIATIFYMKPELLNGSDRRFTFSELVEFETIENARNYIIEKEIEGVMRESHSKQFDWLENKLGMKLRSDLSAWPKFIEITERRNLFTHTDGIVSSQYLDVCRRHMVDSKGANVGDRLTVNRRYLETAYQTLIEMGVKLAHVVWRKLNPDDREAADRNLNLICFELLKRGDYQSAKVLLDFAVELRKWHSELYRRMFVMNRAQAYKFGNENDRAQEILDNEDWSLCSKDFLLCLSVLRDQYEHAANIMRELDKTGDIKRAEYAAWPIFKEFRKTPEFGKAYTEIYGEKFTISTTADKVALDVNIQPPSDDQSLPELHRMAEVSLTDGSPAV